MPVSVVQINMKKAFAAAVELNSSLTSLNHYIGLLTEPYVHNGKLCSLPPMCDSISEGKDPRAAIICNKEIKITKLGSLSHRDCAVGLASFKNQSIILASIYMDIKRPMNPPWLEKLFNYSNEKKLPILIGMDSNAHSTLYGVETNQRGEELEELLILNGVSIENIGTSPTFYSERNGEQISSTIDVTLSRGLSDQIWNWKVLDQYNGSDHRTITYTLNEVVRETEKRRIWEDVPWAEFQEEIGKYKLYHPARVNEKKLDKMVDSLYKVINKALDKVSPKRKVKINNKDFFWFSDEHREIKKKVN